MPAVGSLKWNTQLETAATVHSSNMANYNFFSHQGLDGKRSVNRAQDAGYPSTYVGENIAAGQPTLERVMREWMASEGHCKNLMNGSYREMGAAMVENRDATYRYYWTQVFGRQ